MAKPIVDGIEKDLEGRATVVRLGVTSDLGIQAARRYGVRGVPTLVLFDGAGRPVDQSVGIPDRDRVVARVEELLD
jgi:thioredoxin-like negative regulator of GroEL